MKVTIRFDDYDKPLLLIKNVEDVYGITRDKLTDIRKLPRRRQKEIIAALTEITRKLNAIVVVEEAKLRTLERIKKK